MRVLDPGQPPAAGVAALLLDGNGGRPVDLGDTVVVVPTSGASRAIRRELARQSEGVLSPEFRLPMAVMLDAGDPSLASPVERLSAWAAVLRAARRGSLGALIPPAVPMDQPEDVLGAAARLLAVCDALAEAALSPASPELAGLSESDAPRWRTFAVLYEAYLEELQRAGRREANEVRLAAVAESFKWRRVVVACVPDLPVVTAEFLAACRAGGVVVEVVVADPGVSDAPMDAWGRPDPEWWATHPLQIPDDCLVTARDVAGEAGGLLDFIAMHGEGGFGLVAAAPESVTALAAAVDARGRESYVPEGIPLRRTESATILLGWQRFAGSQRLRDLRDLLRVPMFSRLLTAGAEERLTADEAAEACERLLAGPLCETLPAAKDWLRHAPASDHAGERRERALMGALVRAVDSLLDRLGDGAALLDEAVGGEDGLEERGAEISAMAEALDEMATSPWTGGLPEDWKQAVLRAAIERRAVFPAAGAGSVEISGWLEAPWVGGDVLAVAGCREGALPSGASEDAFLPDGVRVRLGLPSLASRYARDAFMLAGLLARYGSGRLRLGFARFRPGGEPNLPSRLLFGCPDEGLPARVRRVFDPVTSRCQVSRPAGWRLRFDVQPPPVSMRATGFSQYLACPLRFYLSQVARLQSFDADGRELDASGFGSLVHRVLERWHREGPASSDDPKALAACLDATLDDEVVRRFGRYPSAVVRVQVETIRARLRQFAVEQAAQRREGWRVIESEYAVKPRDGCRVGPLLLAGTIDRVEVHEERGLRVLDYKTFSVPHTPEEKHFGPARELPHLPEAAIKRPDRRGAPRDKSWRDLQLPVYRALAERVWPEEAERGLEVGYFLLPADPSETRVEVFALDDETQAAAWRCAVAVSGLVHRGVFWPPAPPGSVTFDDFAGWFGGEDPAAVLDPETIAKLEGRP